MLTRITFLSLIGTALIASGHAATLIAYVEAPTVQATTVLAATTVDFNSYSTGTFTSALTTPIGTYDSGGGPAYAIVTSDAYGGAGHTGNYLAIGAQSGSTGPVSLNLNTPTNFFGFWWSAGDSANFITFYSGNSLLATFTTGNIISLIPNDPNTTVTAINGSVYHTNAYYDNPNGGDPSEPFAYVDVIASGMTFDKVTFSNANQGTGFESDNHSVASDVTGPPITSVLVQDIPLVTPEPGTDALIGSALCALAMVRVRKSIQK